MFRALVLSVLTTWLAASAVRAQVHPPRSGVPLPEGYYERIAEDRTAFQFKRAWIAETRRVQEQRRLMRKGLLTAAQAPAVSGTKRVPVLVGSYSNTGAPPHTLNDLENRLFDGPNITGTVTDYYTEISGGRITLTGDIIGSGANPYPLPNTDGYYEGGSGCNGLCSGAKTGEFLKSVLDGVDGNVDFGQYDNDGPDGEPNSGDDDGYVDFVAFVHPEAGGECGNNNMWSHRWVYEGWWGTAYETNDAAARGGVIRVSDYTIQPLVSCDGSSLIEIGVYAHEFGHAFGLPDLYDTNTGDGNSQGIGNWGLMASGSWGGDGEHPSTPSHMCAWSKEQLGWVEPTTLCTFDDVVLSPVRKSGEVIRIYPHGSQDTEYFLLEYRVQEGFDAYLPTAGVAVWHIDGDNPGNGNENKKLVDLEEADGNFDLDNAVNRGDRGDLYPGFTNNQAFDIDSTPNSRANNGVPTGIAITNFGYDDEDITFSVELTECRLGLQGLAVNDAEWGDNAGNLGPLELVEITVCVGNAFDLVRSGVALTLSTSSEKVSLQTDQADLGTVGPGNPQCATFWIQAGAGLEDGEEIPFDVTLTADGGYVSEHEASLFAGQYVLIVEDNGVSAYSNDYVNAVEAAGYTPVVYDTEDLSHPSSGTLRGALAVVWFTGPDSFTTLQAEEQDAIREYLENGGTLFLSGDDIGYDLVQDGNGSDRLFYEEWLKARFVTDITDSRTLNGVADNPIGDGLSFSLNAIKSKWPSIIEPVGGSQAVFEYDTGGVGAIYFEGDYNLLYTAFNFEAGSATQRNEVMTRFLSRHVSADLNPPELTLTSDSEEAVDACDSVTVTWSASDESGIDAVEVFLYRGDDLERSVALLQGDPGAFTWHTDVPGEDLSLKIVARDPSGLQSVVATPVFSVADTDDPTVAVTYPNGGENLQPGAEVEFSWIQEDCSSIVRATVDLSRDGGVTWETLGETAGESALSWTAPQEPGSGMRLRVEVEDAAGKVAVDESDGNFAVGENDPFGGATRAVLLQNRPNPFATETSWLFYLPQASEVTLTVYDTQGRTVRTLHSGPMGQGEQQIPWDGNDDLGQPVPSGVYFMRLDSEVGSQTRKLVRLSGSS